MYKPGELKEKITFLSNEERKIHQNRERYLLRCEEKLKEIIESKIKEIVNFLVNKKLDGGIIKNVCPKELIGLLDVNTNEGGVSRFYYKALELVDNYWEESKEKKTKNNETGLFLTLTPLDTKIDEHQDKLKEIDFKIKFLQVLVLGCEQENKISEKLHEFIFEEIVFLLCKLGILTEELDTITTERPKGKLKQYDKLKDRCFNLIDKVDEVYFIVNQKQPPNLENERNFLWD